MKKTLLGIIFVLLCSCSKYNGDEDSLDYNKVEIVFDGHGDYDTESKITLVFTDSIVVGNLNQLKNKSSSNSFAALKATEYSIRLYFENSDTNEKLLIKISKSEGRTATIEYGAGTIFDAKYQNTELVQYVSELLRLDDLKSHKGKLSQTEYENIILRKE